MLWLWRRPVATAPIRPLAWEPPYAAEAAQEIATTTTTTKKAKDKKKNKKTKKRFNHTTNSPCSDLMLTKQTFDYNLFSWVVSRFSLEEILFFLDENAHPGSSRRGAVVNESD